MEDFVYYNNLYDLYGVLLTDKQKKYFEDYYFYNLSFAEMADNYNVSRNAVFKQLHIVIEKLEDYEEKLHLLKKRNTLGEIANKIEDSNIRQLLEKLI